MAAAHQWRGSSKGEQRGSSDTLRDLILPLHHIQPNDWWSEIAEELLVVIWRAAVLQVYMWVCKCASRWNSKALCYFVFQRMKTHLILSVILPHMQFKSMWKEGITLRESRLTLEERELFIFVVVASKRPFQKTPMYQSRLNPLSSQQISQDSISSLNGRSKVGECLQDIQEITQLWSCPQV